MHTVMCEHILTLVINFVRVQPSDLIHHRPGAVVIPRVILGVHHIQRDTRTVVRPIRLLRHDVLGRLIELNGTRVILISVPCKRRYIRLHAIESLIVNALIEGNTVAHLDVTGVARCAPKLPSVIADVGKWFAYVTVASGVWKPHTLVGVSRHSPISVRAATL